MKVAEIDELNMDEDTLYWSPESGAKSCVIPTTTQYVHNVGKFSSQYGDDRTMSYVAINVVGKPSFYPEAGEHNSVFHMRTYGPWWNILPSSEFTKMSSVLPKGRSVQSQDFIELQFSQHVFPQMLSLYETYNPGSLIRISGYSYETKRWKELWLGEPQNERPLKARILSLPLRPMNFSTDLYRLEFYHQHLGYYYELDAVSLEGIEDEEDGGYVYSSLPRHKRNSKSVSKYNKTLSTCYFEKLPNEVAHLILSYLDLESLCAASRVSKFFKRLCYDPILFRVLDLQPYWHKVSTSTLVGLQGRCSSLQRLNLSWCGDHHRLDPGVFTKFIEDRCQFLTCLKLCNCPFIDNYCVRVIAKYCHELQVLDLSGCRHKQLNHVGFSQISQMKNLIYLNLSSTSIDKYPLLIIIKSCSKLEHLLLGSCTGLHYYDEIIREIGKHLRSLKTLELFRAKPLRDAEVSYLAANCQNLVELDLGWCLNLNASSGCLREIIRNCNKLQKLFLTAIRSTSDAELSLIASCCKDLQQLDVLGTREVTPEGVMIVLQSCKKLKLLDVSFCYYINRKNYEVLCGLFPNIQIKSAYCPNSNNVA